MAPMGKIRQCFKVRVNLEWIPTRCNEGPT